MNVKSVASIKSYLAQRFACIAFALLRTKDCQPYLCPVMKDRIIEDVYQSHSLTIFLAYYKADLLVGMYVVLLTEDVILKVIATIWNVGISHVPHLGVILYGVEKLEVTGFKSTKYHSSL